MLKIDGYTAPSKDVAFDQGVTFTYPTQAGDITIRSKMAGRDNAPYRLALQNHSQWSNRRRGLVKGQIDNEAEERFLGLIHDHLVISWSTAMKSGGSEIAPTRENFIALMKHPAAKGVIDLYLEDSGEEDNFRPTSNEELVGKSDTPSGGSSNGETKKTGS